VNQHETCLDNTRCGFQIGHFDQDLISEAIQLVKGAK
jgi:hypothetical protein